MKLMYLQQIGVNTWYYVVTLGVLVWMKVLQERIAMDLVALNIISILALMFFPISKSSVSKLVNWHMILKIMFNVFWFREFCGWLSYLEYEQ